MFNGKTKCKKTFLYPVCCRVTYVDLQLYGLFTLRQKNICVCFKCAAGARRKIQICCSLTRAVPTFVGTANHV